MSIRLIHEQVNPSELAAKGNSRIFVTNEDDLQRVKNILLNLDADEYLNHCPEKLVAVIREDTGNELIYNGKFDLEVDKLIEACKAEEIDVVVYSCNPYEYEAYLTVEMLGYKFETN